MLTEETKTIIKLVQDFIGVESDNPMSDAKDRAIIELAAEIERLQARVEELAREQQIIFDNAAVGILFNRQRKVFRCNQRLNQIFGRIEDWTMTKTKFEAMNILNEFDIPCGPILSMKEIAEDDSLRATGTIVEVDHPKRGKYLSVGNPIKLSDSPTEVTRSPLLGEHTEEILTKVLGYSSSEIETIKTSGAITAPEKPAKAA